MQSRFFWGSAIIVLEHKCACIKNQTSRFDFCMRFALVLFIPFFLVQLYRWFYIWFVWMPPVIFIGVFDFLSSAFGPDRAYLFSLSLALSPFFSVSLNQSSSFFNQRHMKILCWSSHNQLHWSRLNLAFRRKITKKKKIIYYPSVYKCNKLIDIKWFWKTEIARWLSIKHKEESPLQVAIIILKLTAFRRAFNLHFDFTCLAHIMPL